MVEKKNSTEKTDFQITLGGLIFMLENKYEIELSEKH